MDPLSDLLGKERVFHFHDSGNLFAKAVEGSPHVIKDAPIQQHKTINQY